MPSEASAASSPQKGPWLLPFLRHIELLVASLKETQNEVAILRAQQAAMPPDLKWTLVHSGKTPVATQVASATRASVFTQEAVQAILCGN